MKKIIKLNQVIFLTALLGLYLSFYTAAAAMVVSEEGAANEPAGVTDRDSDQAPEPQYAPGEVLVKFKDGIDPNSVLQGIGLEAKSVDRIHSIKPAVAKFKKDYELEKTSKGWYSFLGKNYKEVNDIPDEALFGEAYKKMPESEKGLYRSYKLILPDGMDVREAMAKLKDNPDVEYVEPNRIVKIQMVPNDPYYHSSGSWGQPYDDLWGIKKINCEQAWDISQGEGVVVAVIDTGVDYNHPDLAANIWTNPAEIPGNGIDDDGNGYVDDVRGWDFVNGDNDPMDDKYHGTHCAGIIAAVGNNNSGVIGVAPKAKIMAVKGLNYKGAGYESNLAACVKYAVDNGAHILSNSWGGIGIRPVFTDAFHYAYSKGCVAIAAAGNAGSDASLYSPANIDTVMAIAATTQNDEVTFFSNRGKKIDVSAPGGGYKDELGNGMLDVYNVLSTFPYLYSGSDPRILSQGYCRLAGTSMACPHAAGVAALIKSKYPSDPADDIRFRMMGGADCIDSLNPGCEGALGSGRVNAYNSLVLTLGPLIKLKQVDYHKVIPGYNNGEIVVSLQAVRLDWNNVVATLTTTNPSVTIQTGTVSFGNIPVGQTATNAAAPFKISISPDVKFGEKILFSLRVTADGGAEKIFDFNRTIAYFNFSPAANLPTTDFIAWHANMEDYNGDDCADISMLGWTVVTPIPTVLEHGSSLYKNLGDGSFIKSTDTAGINYGSKAHVTLLIDIDNDGNKDLFIASGGNLPSDNKLFLNNGDGTFSDITAGSGVDVLACYAAIPIDYNNDGFIDILGAGDKDRLFLFQNNGNNTFTDVIGQTGMSLSTVDIFFGQIISFDYDNDSYPDILLAYMGEVKLYHNNGDGTFTDVTAKCGFDLLDWGAEYAAVGDYDNDGYTDIFLNICLTASGGWDNLNALYHNNGDGTFSNVTKEAGNVGFGMLPESWGVAFLDCDNDGNLDLYLPAVLYRNNGDGTFTCVQDGACFGGGEAGSVACFGDYNNDGTLDVYTPPAQEGGGGLFNNEAGLANNWLKIKLRGVKNNRDAYGAKVYVQTGALTQSREISNSPVQTQPLHFGLGNATIIDEIKVVWPGGKEQQLTDVNANQLLTIKENRPPELTIQVKYGGTTITEGQGICIVVSATDGDGDPLTYSTSELPAGAIFNPAGGPPYSDVGTPFFRWVPRFNQAGNYPVTFTVSDGDSQVSETITITVRPSKIDFNHDGTISTEEARQASLGFLAGLGRPVFYNERYDFDSNGSISAVDFLILKNVLSDPAVNKIYIFKAARLIDQDRNAIVTPAEINTALKAVKAHLLTKPGMPGWDEQYDIDNSGAVMAPDLQIVKNFGTNEYGDIIAIELEGLNPWTLNSVVLGTKTGNLGENSQPMHKIKNIGNTPVAIEVGYGPGIPEGIHPGLQQGLDTFITLAAGVIIPPSEKINLGKVIQPGEAEPLPLIYGAPTGLSGQTREMSLNLEIRVYAAVNQE